MLANVKPGVVWGPREKQPLEQSPSQTNTGLHQGFPQTSTHFSVPAMGFFSPSDIHKHIYIYIRKQKENVHAAEYSKKETVFTILSNFSRVPDELLFPQLLAERSLPACSGAPVRVSCTGGGQTG